ncbi:MAG: hypothetical protein LAO19_09670 [Acidobacteriia bacterium]|nr:hypothetical protein [Terriglobia bacterium]
MISANQPHDAFQFTFQGSFDFIGLALAASHTADVGRINLQIAGNTPI